MLMMTETCPNCGEELNIDNAAGGLCGRCLLERGIEFTSTACFADGSTPGTPPFAAPDPIEVEADLLSFDVLELVGQGGMGAVYKARQRNLDRTVAIKILPRQSGGQEFADRFQREARALARLRHDNIVMAYDFGLTDRYSYCVMEYVGGPNLREYLREQRASSSEPSPSGKGQGEGARLPPRHALEIARDICTALQFAHENGVVHRDIKPENVLLDETGRVKIADFGLAKLLATDPRELALTQTRHFMGTVHYMAPEQCERPQATDHRADIYSVGVMLYEMLTGELPLGRFDPPSSKTGVDPRVDNLVLRALEKDPAKRYASAAELGKAIDALLEDPVSLVPAASAATGLVQPADIDRPTADAGGRSNRRRGALVAAGLFGFFATVFLGWYIFIKYQSNKDGANLTVEMGGGEGGTSKTTDRTPAGAAATSKQSQRRAGGGTSDLTFTASDKVTKVFRLNESLAHETAQMLEKLFPDDDIRLAADKSSNSIIAEGDRATLSQIEDLLQRFDRPPNRRRDGPQQRPADAQNTSAKEEMRVFALRNTRAQDAVRMFPQNIPDFTGRIAIDDRTNSIVVGTDSETMSKVAAIIGRLDQPPASAGKRADEWPANNPGTLDPGEEIRLSAFGTLPDAPIAGMYPIDPDGYANLGAEYGKVKVAGLTVHEAVDAILAELKKTLDASKLAVQIEGVFKGNTPANRRRGSARPGTHATQEDLKRQRDQIESDVATLRARRLELQTQRGIPNARATPETKRLDDEVFNLDRQIRMLENWLRQSDVQSGPRATIINPGYSLRINVAGTLPDAPIKGVYPIDPDGYVNLGAEYGKVRVSGMSADEAQAAILAELKKTLADPKIVVTIDSVGRNTPDDRRRGSDALPPELQQLTPEDRKLLAEKPSARTVIQDGFKLKVAPDGQILESQPLTAEEKKLTPEQIAARDGHVLAGSEKHDAGHESADVASDNEVSILRRVDPPVREANKTAKRTEEMPLQIAHVEAMQKETGQLAVAWEMYGHVPRTIFGRRGNADEEFVVPYLLIVKGPHLGRKELIIPSWPPGAIQAEDYAGTIVAPRKLRISNGEPLEIYIEQGSIPGKSPVRVSNIVKIIWRVPGAPTEDIRYPKSLMKPFAAIHWEKERPQVEIEGRWYELLGIENRSMDDILEYAKKAYPKEYETKIENDLESLLKMLDLKQLDNLQIKLRRLDNGQVEAIDVRRTTDGAEVVQRSTVEEKPAEKKSEDGKKK